MNKRPRFLRLTVREQVVLLKRLGMLLGSNASVVSALEMLWDESSTVSGKYLLNTLAQHVSEGKTLARGFEVCEVFGPFVVSMVSIGEASGSLSENLVYLSEELKKQDAIKKKVISAFVYPTIIMVATIGISLVLTVYIFPKVTPLFQSFKEQLPLSTRVLMSISHVLRTDWMWILVSLACLVAVLTWVLRKSFVRELTDRCVLHIPVVGKIVQLYNLVLISRTMGLLLSSDARVVEALALSATTLSHSGYRTMLMATSNTVSSGQLLSSGLAGSTMLFPSLFVQMIRVGEQTGDVAGSMRYVSHMYEDELTENIKNLTTLVEPVLMVFMGLVVGFVAISIISPIYAITQNLNHYK